MSLSKEGLNVDRNAEHGAKPFVVIGVGNPLLGDDGVGIRVVEALMERDLPSWVQVIDAGTGGVTLLHLMEGAAKALLVDAVSWGGPPGEITRFRPEEVVSACTSRGFSIHASDLLDVLGLARELGMCPEEVIIYGIQPRAVEQGMELSSEVSAAIPHVVDSVVAEIYQFSKNKIGGTSR